MLLSQASLAVVERAINAALAFDPASRNALGELAGQVLAIRITTPAITFYLMPEQDGVALMSEWDGEVDATLQGSLAAFLRVAVSENVSLHGSGVTFVGKTSLISGLTAIAKSLDLDWEEMLSTLVGDVAGHQAFSLLREQFGWLRNRRDNARLYTRDFLQFELNALPAANELNRFYQNVDELRFDADRVFAKFLKLQSQNKPQS